MLEIYKEKNVTGAPAEPSEALATKLKGLLFAQAHTLTDNQVRRIYTSLNDTVVGDVLAAIPKDQIVLTYMAGRKAIPFERASPRQQASALLELLLRQAAGTLIIDQPEDDLDNRVVMKIVELIRTSKSNRQLSSQRIIQISS